MSLAQKTILKSEKLLSDDRIQKIESNVYLVYGSKDTVYQVDFNADTKLVKCQCKGYRMKGDCYHSEAIRIKENLK